MVKQIVRDVFFLGQPSETATKADIQVGKDLQDTLQANRERCVGMAANMIGVKKNIIIVNMGFIDSFYCIHHTLIPLEIILRISILHTFSDFPPLHLPLQPSLHCHRYKIHIK